MFSRALLVFLVAIPFVWCQYGDQAPVNITFTHTQWNNAPLSIWGLVHLPSDYSTTPSSTAYPLLVFFHGAGENSATRSLSDLSKISNTYGPCAEIKNGKSMDFVVGGETFKFIVVCPQYTSGWWPQDGWAINNFLNSVIALYPKVDLNRIYFTGLSAGGYTTFTYADASTTYASRLAAITPVSADVPPNVNQICNVASSNVPMWSIVGDGESLHRANNDAVNAYNACPTRTYTASITPIAGGGHNAFTWNRAYSTDHTYFNPNMYEWLLQYSRASISPVTPAPTAAPTTPAPTSAPTCAPAPVGAGTGLRAEYYTGKDFNSLKAVRIDPNVNYNYASAGPSGVGAFPVDLFSVRWSGSLLAQYTGVHTFYTSSDDGIRVYIDNTLVVNDFTDHSQRETSGTIALVAGTEYPITVEYYENAGSAVATLSWSFSDCIAKSIVPTSQLFPEPISIC